MKKIIWLIIIGLHSIAFWKAIDVREPPYVREPIEPSKIIPIDDTIGGRATVDRTAWMFNSVLEFISESIFWLLWLISIGLFLYVWFKMLKAEWNPEEMKKAFQTLIHIIVGLFIVAFAWWFIKIIASLNI